MSNLGTKTMRPLPKLNEQQAQQMVDAFKDAFGDIATILRAKSTRPRRHS